MQDAKFKKELKQSQTMVNKSIGNLDEHFLFQILYTNTNFESTRKAVLESVTHVKGKKTLYKSLQGPEEVE